MLWIDERMERIKGYAAKAGLLDGDATVAVLTADGPVVADTEKNNYDVDGQITTDAVDLGGEVVNPEGGDWTYLDTVKSVFVDHDPTVASAVGVMRFRSPVQMGGRTRGWRARIRLDRSKSLARDCMALARLGVLHSSIGVIAVERGKPSSEEKTRYDTPGRKTVSVIRRWRALEITLTAAPMNAECRMHPTEYVEKSLSRVRKAMEDGLVSEAGAAAFGVVRKATVVVAGFHGGYTWRRRK